MSLPAGMRFVRIRRIAGLVLSAGLLSACAVGPDYREPPLPARDEWQSQPQTGASADAATLASWWTALNDPTLNQLVERAVAENKTVKQAVSRVIESRARRSITAAGFFPTIASSAGGSHTDSDSSGPDANSGADSFGSGARET